MVSSRIPSRGMPPVGAAVTRERGFVRHQPNRQNDSTEPVQGPRGRRRRLLRLGKLGRCTAPCNRDVPISLNPSRLLLLLPSFALRESALRITTTETGEVSNIKSWVLYQENAVTESVGETEEV